MMLKRTLAIIVLLIMMSAPSWAQTAFGIETGTNHYFALSAGIERFDVALGLHTGPEAYVHIVVDFSLFDIELIHRVNLFAGAGLDTRYVTEAEEIGIGARIPIGFEFLPSEHWEISIDAAPTYLWTPISEYATEGEICVRYRL